VEDQPIGKVGGTVRRYSNSFWLTSRQIRSQRNRNTTWPTHPPSPFYTAHPVEKMIDNHEKLMKAISTGYIDVTVPHFSIAFVSGNDHGDKVGRVCLFASTKRLLSGHLSTSNVTFGFDDLRS
jgi:hypothetical protein